MNPNDVLGRRRFLQTTAAVSVATLAGCVALGDRGATANEGSSEGDGEGTDDGQSSTPVETDHPYTSPPSVVDLDESDGEVTLRTVPARHVLVSEGADGGPIEFPEVWAWQANDHPPSVPGPILRVTEGNEMKIHYENSEHARPHTVHLHGVRKRWIDDGASVSTGERVDPGDSYTYEIEANTTGTHHYHCHYQTQNHLDMGMYGMLRIDPVDYEPPEKEFFLTIKDWDSRLSETMAGGNAEFTHRDRNPDRFTINGRSGPYTFHPEQGSPLIVESGDTVRIHLANNGYEAHPIHLHNHRFRVVEKDGGTIPEEARHEEDVTNIAPAERKVLEFEADADPGIYLLHCHKVHHVMNGDAYPGGMVTAIVYEEAMDSEQFANVMEKAGYEG